MTREYLQLKNEFWSDLYVGSLSAQQKLVYIYLLMQHCLNGHDFFEISERRIAFETRVTEDGVRWTIRELERDGQIVRDGEKIRLVNAHKYVNSPQGEVV